MTDIPIIFSAPMVQALLVGRKTMTRRLAWGKARRLAWQPKDQPAAKRPTDWQRVKPGDRLWVRETWCDPDQDHRAVYRADLTSGQLKESEQVMRATRKQRASDYHYRPWRSPIHCPRWASRLTLIITATKIEPLQMIRNADILAEGIPGDPPQSIVFAALWDSLHGEGAWRANPEIVALTFAVHKQNIDAMKEGA